MKSIRRCEIVTNLKNGDEIFIEIETIKKVLSEKNCILDYAYIIHDNDNYTAHDEKKNPDHKCGELKPAHIHLLLRFKKSQPQKLECVANWFGIKPNFISKINGSWEDACLYQIHKNAPDKHQYSADEVVSNFDYEKLLHDEENKFNLQDILRRILDGDIREYNKTLEIDHIMLVSQARYINEAFKVRSEHLQATIKERNTECVFITGGSGVGKSTLAKNIAKEKGLDYFISSGSNDIMDGYSQEPCLIVDDMRPAVLGLSDLLKMLDNHTASSVKSRYKNKYLNCELIIVTTVLDINTFYQNVFAERDEPITQLKRRCGTYIQMDAGTIYISIWDSKRMKYTAPIAYKNNVLDQYVSQENKTGKDVRNHVSNIIPFLELKKDEVIDTDTFHLERVHKTIAKHNSHKTYAPSHTESISDEDYRKLLPDNK